MKTSTVRAVSHALPTRRLTNDVLAQRFGEQAMQSITKMSGIHERRIVAPGQCASDLGEVAARRLMAAHDVDPASIDLIIFCSQTPDYRIPATANVLHGRLGLPERCSAFDVNQACASYIHSLQIAHAMLVAGAAKRALLINADTLSKITHTEDRTMVPLNGDAGTATLLEPCNPDDGGFEHFRICNDGTKFDKILVPAGGTRLPSSAKTAEPVSSDDGVIRSLDTVHMDGPAVFHFAVHTVGQFLANCLADWGYSGADLGTVLLHQANNTMVDFVYKAARIPETARFKNIETVGNAACASLPLLLSDAARAGVLSAGSRTILCGFGGGLSWAAAAITWPDGSDPAVHGTVETDFGATADA